jgi:hypothetical protein
LKRAFGSSLQAFSYLRICANWQPHLPFSKSYQAITSNISDQAFD